MVMDEEGDPLHPGWAFRDVGALKIARRGVGPGRGRAGRDYAMASKPARADSSSPRWATRA